MTDEELNRKFEVVANLIADLSVSQQKAEERMKRVDDHMIRTGDRVARIERILTLAIRAGRRERREWRERHTALVEAQALTEAALTRMAEAQAHTDSRLDALIDIVREGRNGKGE